jgi:arginine utilization protein RocB
VGVDKHIRKYGADEALPFDPDRLPEWLSRVFPADKELHDDLASGEWMCGRGAFDMKGGSAVALELAKHLAQCGFPWNVVLLLTADEETESRGIKSALPALAKLQQAGMKFRLLLNLDYTSALTPGDTNAYAYTGTIGKALIGLTVYGTETHAGAPFEGVNAAALLSAILARLEGNQKLTQHVKGEFTPPPTALSADARQPEYSVTTPAFGRALLNVFFMHHTHGEYLRLITNEVRRACRLHITDLKRRHSRMCAKANLDIGEKLVLPEVLTFSTLRKRLEDALGKDEATAVLKAPEGVTEPREACLRIVEQAARKLDFQRPTVIVSVLPPFYAPYSAALHDDAKEVYVAVRKLAQDSRGNAPELKQRHFYPYISDMSFLALPGDGKLTPLLENCPAQELLALPRAELRLRMPVVNLGPLGKDAHRVAERVHIPFLTQRLPLLCLQLLEELTGSELVRPD